MSQKPTPTPTTPAPGHMTLIVAPGKHSVILTILSDKKRLSGAGLTAVNQIMAAHPQSEIVLHITRDPAVFYDSLRQAEVLPS